MIRRRPTSWRPWSTRGERKGPRLSDAPGQAGSDLRRGSALATQLIAAGEQPIAIVVNGETTAEVRDKGARIGFSILAPKIIKPNGFFMAKKAPHPYAALLFTDWTLSEEGQKTLAVELGKGVAMTGLPVKYKEFQGEPTMSSPPNSEIS